MRRPAQVWWITGAGAGIGRELAVRLAADGHQVYATARTRADLDSLAALYPQHITALPADVSDESAMAGLWQTLSSPPSALDGVILAAGICEYVDAPEFNIASFRRVMDVNFHGIVLACQAAIPLLLASKSGKPRLIGIGSLSSVVGLPRAEAYGASKAAMHYFFDALRCDLGRKLDITVVQPGFVATRLTARNDFAMPFLWTSERAADHLYQRLWSSGLLIRFPWQLSFVLRMAAWLPSLWYRTLAPRLSRTPSPTVQGNKP